MSRGRESGLFPQVDEDEELAAWMVWKLLNGNLNLKSNLEARQRRKHGGKKGQDQQD
jgi:hypothetical protein